MPDGPIRILLVDDHAMVRRGMRDFLSLHDDIEVVGEASDGLEAVERATAAVVGRSPGPMIALRRGRSGTPPCASWDAHQPEPARATASCPADVQPTPRPVRRSYREVSLACCARARGRLGARRRTSRARARS